MIFFQGNADGWLNGGPVLTSTVTRKETFLRQYHLQKEVNMLIHPQAPWYNMIVSNITNISKVDSNSKYCKALFLRSPFD